MTSPPAIIAALDSAAPELDDDACAVAWAQSGAMALSGSRQGPPSVAPAGLARPLGDLGAALESAASSLPRRVRVDALALLAQRAAFTGARRQGAVSVGGSARLLRARDAWIALNLPRASDAEALPALFGLARCGHSQAAEVAAAARLGAAAPVNSVGDAGIRRRPSEPAPGMDMKARRLANAADALRTGGDAGVTRRSLRASRARERAAVCRQGLGRGAALDWSEVTRVVAGLPAAHVVRAAAMLGLAAAQAGEITAPALPWSSRWSRPARRASNRPPLVVDLSSLWAGPLASALLAQAGCRVVKVESESRPDSARRDDQRFFDLLNASKRSVRLALPEPRAVARLRSLISAADLVIDSSRPRVMQQWGIDCAETARAGTAWLSITGHDRWGDHANRVAFGDDAAVAGGLVVEGDPPLFAGDASADPIAGLAAAAVAAQLLAARRSAVVNVSLASAAAWAVARAGGPIERAVVPSGSGWAVIVKDRSVSVERPSRDGAAFSTAAADGLSRDAAASSAGGGQTHERPIR